jgi:hypothetical protein
MVHCQRASEDLLVRVRSKGSATAWTRRRCRFLISRLLFSSFRPGFAGRVCGFPVSFSIGLRRLVSRAFHSFLCLSGNGFAGLFRFLAYSLGSLFCFLAYRLGSLFGLLPDRFSGLLRLFPYGF